MQTERRLLGADFLRVAACFTVMFHHIVQNMGFSDRFAQLGWMSLFGVIGGLGVGMFFVLSGYLLSRPFWQALDRGEAMPSLRIYALRRAARIVPGYWLSLAVAFVLSFLVFGAVLDGWLVIRFVAGIFMVSDWHWTSLFPVEVNGALWSISYEVTSYLLLPIGFGVAFLAARGLRSYWAIWLMWLVVIAATLGAHWLFVKYVHVDPIGRGWDKGMQGGAKEWMPRINPFAMFAIFAVGALAGGLQVKLQQVRHLVFDVLALLAAAVAIYFIGQCWKAGSVEAYALFGVPYNFPTLPLALGAFLALTPSSRFVGALLDNRLTAFLARISFGVYLWHAELIALLRKFWFTQADHGLTNQWLFILGGSAVVIISLVAGTASYYWLEQPVLNWARGREAGLRERRAARLEALPTA